MGAQSTFLHPGSRNLSHLLALEKIHPLDELVPILQDFREEGKVIVHCHGVFDLLHVGHIRHLEEAKSLGDVLVVTVTPDHYVNKGPHRPAFQQELRVEGLAALSVVDFVAVNYWPTAEYTIKLLQPDVYVKGPDYRDGRLDLTGALKREQAAVESVGGRLVTTYDVQFSSTQLLNRYLPLVPSHVHSWLERFRARHTAEELIGYLDNMRSLRILVVGEAILDEYVYCHALGKSSKEPILAMQFHSKEVHAGGSVAVANHVADFCEHVDLVTYVGTIKPQENLIRQRLKSNVSLSVIYKTGSPTIVKRRFIESYQFAKVFEMYEMNDALLTEREEQECGDLLDEKIGNCDVVIVSDFGHGLMTPRLINLVVQRAPFVAVNTQANAGNMGFHTISKYPKADYVCIHEGELRLDQRGRHDPIRPMMISLADRMRCPTILVTRGKEGTISYHREGGFVESPSLATKVVDRVGAGDAVLSLTSPCAALGMSPEMIGFIGNLAGAQAVMCVGNRDSLDRLSLIRSIESLLK